MTVGKVPRVPVVALAYAVTVTNANVDVALRNSRATEPSIIPKNASESDDCGKFVDPGEHVSFILTPDGISITWAFHPLSLTWKVMNFAMGEL